MIPGDYVEGTWNHWNGPVRGWYIRTDDDGDMIIEIDSNSEANREIVKSEIGFTLGEAYADGLITHGYVKKTDGRFMWLNTDSVKVLLPVDHSHPTHSYETHDTKVKDSIQVGDVYITETP